jgi:hypothetical protein
MRRRSVLTALVLAWPAGATDADPPAERPEPEFLEFLAETAGEDGEDEEFARFLESAEAERALRRVEKQASKDDDDE